MNNAATGEEVNYAYDELQRLISASTTGTQWGLSSVRARLADAVKESRKE